MLKVRAYLALAVVWLPLIILDPVQRFVISSWVRLFPSRKVPVLTGWIRFLAQIVTRPVDVVGGATIPRSPPIPGGAGTLVLMNHQSVFDIPMVVDALTDAYPLIITRKRYQRWIPLVSHLVRFYQYPLVDPTANSTEMKQSLREIKAAAKSADVPLAIFPEGTRTRDGEIGPFRPTGLRIILKQRTWTVYLLVADGFWKRARLKDLLGGMSEIQGRITVAGPFEWTDPGEDSTAFIEDMRETMVERLAEMRATVRT